MFVNLAATKTKKEKAFCFSRSVNNQKNKKNTNIKISSSDAIEKINLRRNCERKKKRFLVTWNGCIVMNAEKKLVVLLHPKNTKTKFFFRKKMELWVFKMVEYWTSINLAQGQIKTKKKCVFREKKICLKDAKSVVFEHNKIGRCHAV